MRALLVALAAVAVAALLACERVEEEDVSRPPSVETPTPAPTATPEAVVTPTPAATATPAVPPGFRPFVAPSEWLGVSFETVVPASWVQRGGGTETFFVPEGVPSNFPYPELPQLIILGRPTVQQPPDDSVRWHHPVITVVGRQGGGGCTGDISSDRAEASSRYVGAEYEWEVFAFSCHEENLNYPPGVDYQGLAAEAHTDSLVFAIVVIVSKGDGSLTEAFEQAVSSFKVSKQER